jgi:alkylhydroperoxidase family enzyme
MSGQHDMSRLRISYVDPATLTDPRMSAEFDRARREGTPRRESHAIRAHVPAVFWSFVDTWQAVFRNGVVDHNLKELCRVYVSRSVNCRYCGNQRSADAIRAGLVEEDYRHLLDFEKSDRYNERQKAALAFAQAITWDLDTDDAFWERLGRHFSEPQIVELGYFIGVTMGQQRFLRTLNLDEHPLGSGGAASQAAE